MKQPQRRTANNLRNTDARRKASTSTEAAERTDDVKAQEAHTASGSGVIDPVPPPAEGSGQRTEPKAPVESRVVMNQDAENPTLITNAPEYGPEKRKLGLPNQTNVDTGHDQHVASRPYGSEPGNFDPKTGAAITNKPEDGGDE